MSNNKAVPAPHGAKINALGRKVTSFQGFDTFPTPKNIRTVTCISDEVTSNCPVTGQPDWYVVEVKYTPGELCVESKTLKLYFHSYRNQGLFCEAFASKIADDLVAALKPYHIEVRVTQKPRGGVSIVAVAERGEFLSDEQAQNERIARSSRDAEAEKVVRAAKNLVRRQRRLQRSLRKK